MKGFEDKVALVTGGASGIGQAAALMFAREGAKAVIADIGDDSGEETVKMIKDAGGEAIFVKTDVSQSSDLEALINKINETYGRLDYALNNAGTMGQFGKTTGCTEENWDFTMNLNLKGVWLSMKYEIPEMQKQGGGAIVNTSSMTGLRGSPGFPAYDASKHGVVGLTKTAALEYAKAGIRVNAVCPSFVITPMMQGFTRGSQEALDRLAAKTPLKRIATSEDVAEAVVWLCSDASSFITGQALLLDGGLSAE
ncbi:SDR family oxidoreductase [Thermodesulfobacteriota bacterium]